MTGKRNEGNGFRCPACLMSWMVKAGFRVSGGERKQQYLCRMCGSITFYPFTDEMLKASIEYGSIKDGVYVL